MRWFLNELRHRFFRKYGTDPPAISAFIARISPN